MSANTGRPETDNVGQTKTSQPTLAAPAPFLLLLFLLLLGLRLFLILFAHDGLFFCLIAHLRLVLIAFVCSSYVFVCVCQGLEYQHDAEGPVAAAAVDIFSEVRIQPTLQVNPKGTLPASSSACCCLCLAFAAADASRLWLLCCCLQRRLLSLPQALLVAAAVSRAAVAELLSPLSLPGVCCRCLGHPLTPPLSLQCFTV